MGCIERESCALRLFLKGRLEEEAAVVSRNEVEPPRSWEGHLAQRMWVSAWVFL